MRLEALLLAIGAFWLGACPFSLWVGRWLLGKDIRDYGDGNPGGANVFRAGGRKAFCLAALLDVAKGMPFVILAHSLFGFPEAIVLAVGLCAILGSAFSPLLGLLVAGYVFFIAPFYWLWNELFVATTPSDWRLIIILQVAAIVVMRWLVDKRFNRSIISTVLHPIGFSFLIVTGLYAGSRQMVGAGAQWKERLYNRETGVE